MAEEQKVKNGFSERLKNGTKESKDVLFWFCFALGAVMMLMVAVKFFWPSADIPQQFNIAYPIILGVYVAIKEVVRWTGEERSSRLGERLVYLWWGAFLVLNVMEFIFGLLGLDGGRFVVPDEMMGIIIEVLIIFALSEISKKVHFVRKNNKNTSG